MKIDKDHIIANLKEVYDPEISINVYELGLIYDINIDEEKFEELIDSALIPIFDAFRIWFRINDNSGDINNVGPLPESRNIFVIIKYIILFPHPVFCTMSCFPPLLITLSIASNWPGRKCVSGPNIFCNSPNAFCWFIGISIN